jgi:hypothetical protein
MTLLRNYSSIFLDRPNKNTKTLLIAGVPSKIRVGNLQNTSQRRYRSDHASLFTGLLTANLC